MLHQINYNNLVKTECYLTFSMQLEKLLSTYNFKHIAVAVSGGGDSMALAHCANLWSKRHNINMTALTVDHRLRSESTEEANTVSSWLQDSGITSHILSWENGQITTSNIQANAREARYRLLIDWCVNCGVDAILLGHHMDDQAETFLLNLFRGSSVDGLACMSIVKSIRGINIVRPLLGLSKKQIIECLEKSNISWVEDPSNQNDKFTRVQIRKLMKDQQVLDCDLLVRRLADTAWHMSRVRNMLEECAEQAFKECCVVHQAGYITCELSKLITMQEDIALRVLAKSLAIVGSCNNYKIRFNSLYDLYINIKNASFKRTTLANCNVSIKKGNLLFTYEFGKSKQYKANITCGDFKWNSKFKVRVGDLALRRCQIGEFIIEYFGCLPTSYRNNELKKHLAANNYDKDILAILPVVATNANIIAVPHLGYYFDSSIKPDEIYIDFDAEEERLL
jgi:tRNA(Ile)-lysidine synthase